MTHISIADYVGPYAGHKDWTPERQRNAGILIPIVNKLLERFEAETGKKLKKNPLTKSHISGVKNGGFRPLDCPVGSEKSSHKQAMGIDVYDYCEDGSNNELDKWLNDDILEAFDLYREHPDDTFLGSDGKLQPWCHLTTRAPLSKRRTFKP